MRYRIMYGCAVTCMTVLFLAGCEAGPEPTEIDGIRLSHAPGVSASTTGGGDFLVTIGEGFQGKFAFSAIQQDPSGTAEGNFHYSLVFFGQLIEFFGRTTCMTVDPVNNRAWIGGVITRNNSSHPGWLTEVHEPGDDIWFRVVDNGEGSGAEVDRTTFVGFEGNRGIITSEEYCDAQFWAETEPWAVVNGNLQVRTR